MTNPPITRREFLFALAGFPFFWRRRFVTLGGIRFERIRRGRSRCTYVFIHGNETTAREVLREHIMKSAGGTAYLVTGGDRYVTIKGVRIDPNRLFSREGAEKSVRGLNPGVPEKRIAASLDYLDRERPKLVKALFPSRDGLLIALHNNREGYSVLDEVPISDRTSLQDRENPHEFFLCTQPEDFEALAQARYNVVLQNAGPKEDDGSLSRLAAKRGARYLNLEAGIGKAARQREMLAAALSMLETAGRTKAPAADALAPA